MVLHTHAPDRRTMVRALQEHLDSEASYAGPPSFAYKIGSMTVERDGTITSPSESDLRALVPFLSERGWMDVPVPQDDRTLSQDATASQDERTPSQDDPTPQHERTPSQDDPINGPSGQPSSPTGTAPDEMSISVPAPGVTAEQLVNLAFLVYSRQYLIRKMIGGDTILIPDAFIEQLKAQPPRTPEDFTDLLDSFRGQGTLNGFDYRDGEFSMVFPFSETNPDRWTVFAGLLGRILQAGCSAKRIHAVRLEPENEKFHARTWLLRLGYGGADLKAERALLLGHLHGCSAFADVAAAKRHSEKYAAIRKARQETARAAAVEAEEVSGHD